MTKKNVDEFESIITNEIPQKSFEISDDKKVDILISLMKDLRININEWTERTYKATIWSIGLMFAIVAFGLTNKMNADFNHQLFIIFGILIIGILTQVFISHALKAHTGTGIALEKCQVSLGFSEEGFYLKDKRFFGYSGKWLKSKSIKILQIFHFFVMLTLIIAVIIF